MRSRTQRDGKMDTLFSGMRFGKTIPQVHCLYTSQGKSLPARLFPFKKIGFENSCASQDPAATLGHMQPWLLPASQFPALPSSQFSRSLAPACATLAPASWWKPFWAHCLPFLGCYALCSSLDPSCNLVGNLLFPHQLLECIPKPNRCSHTFWDPHWFVFPFSFNSTEVSIN